MLQDIRELYEYNRWANLRVLGATAVLALEDFTRDLGNSFPSVRDTLVHVLGAEWIWLMRWKGTSPSDIPAEFKTYEYADIVARWSTLYAEQKAFVDRLDDAALGELIAYRNTQGQPFANALGAMMRHVVNHSTYHRGQVATMLRQLGAQPVSTDLIVFYREQAPVGAPTSQPTA